MTRALDRLRAANPAPPTASAGSEALYAAIIARPRERTGSSRRRRLIGIALIGALALPVGAAALGVFDPADQFRSERPIWSDHPATREARVDERSTQLALTRALPDGRHLEIWTAQLTGGAGACIGVRLAGEPELLRSINRPHCGPYVSGMDPEGTTLRRTGFEDPEFATVPGGEHPLRLMYGLLSPEIARRAAEIRVTRTPGGLDVSPESLRSPARGVYAIVLSGFDPARQDAPSLVALDADGQVIARQRGSTPAVPH
jgi:hypothetical protein